MADRIGSDGRIIRSGDSSSEGSSSTSSTAYTPPYAPSREVSELLASYESEKRKKVGIVFAVIAIIGIFIGLCFTGLGGMFPLPNRLFDGYGWVYWIAFALAIIVPTIVLIAKEEDFPSGAWAFVSILATNATTLISAHLLNSLLIPALSELRLSWSYEAGGMGKLFNLWAVLRFIGMYTPQIVLIIGLLSFIFIIYRYDNEYEIYPIDVLWTFVVCGLIIPIGLLLAVALIIAVVWVIIVLIKIVLSIIICAIILIAFLSGCCN